ncbi:MAG TPA: M20 family metallopeptidase [Candidatus Angelobacter sp.]|jgi:glutamate carboxypeptidase|nr:M20 family metallopeptidase [Candidatus Angelobacter sp.]
MANLVSTERLPQILQFTIQSQPEMLQALQYLVEIESPSDDKTAVNKMGAHLGREFESLGGRITFHQTQDFGNHLQMEFAGRAGQKPVMLLGHFDTVWPLGTLANLPFRVADGRAYGPGILDMKAGIVMSLYAMGALRELSAREHRPVTILLSSDEEAGSNSSRAIIEDIAKGCEAVLVLEPAQGPQGSLKTARKGLGTYYIRVHGHASHAGVDFEKGHSAIVELSRQILEITKFTDLTRGITVSPGVVRGGTRSNVVAAEALVEVDIRVARAVDSARLKEQFLSLRSFDPNCRLEVTGGLNRPPMERTAGTVRLLETAQDVAKTLGFDLGESATGGGSDGNFTSALGIATLDGLGAVGEGAHAAHESIFLEQLPLRTALLAGLIATI